MNARRHPPVAAPLERSNNDVGLVHFLAEIVRHPAMASYLSCRLLARRLSGHI